MLESVSQFRVVGGAALAVHADGNMVLLKQFDLARRTGKTLVQYVISLEATVIVNNHLKKELKQ